jgi:hypothetical protein
MRHIALGYRIMDYAALVVVLPILAGILASIIVSLLAYIRRSIHSLMLAERDRRFMLERLHSSPNADYAGTIKSLSVTSLFLKDRLRSDIITYMILAAILFAGIIENRFSSSDRAFDIFVLSYGFLILLDGMLLAYRVRRGFYGNNEGEAREIITYILRNSDKLDDGDGTRRIFDSAEPEATLAEKIIPLGGRLR